MSAASDGARRRLLIVAGDPATAARWVDAQLAASAPQLAAGDVLWLAEHAPSGRPCVSPRAITQRLGGECRVLVVDMHQGFHPDAFAAAVGTLRGGGDCVLLAPPLGEWSGFDDPDRRRFCAYPHATTAMHGRFLGRLARIWVDHAAVHRISADSADAVRVAPAAAGVGVTLNPAQRRIALQVESVARGHARRPLVITADRGRGKSTLLGVCAARLLRQGVARVTVVAPGRAAVATLYRHARQLTAVDTAHEIPPRLRIGDGELCFRLPSEWHDDDGAAASLVIVDEAAAIPLAVLERLLQTANRLVFASTVHGYEGSGRGFALRFAAALDARMPQWRAAQLDTPVRWAADDPLEDLLNRSLLLDAELADAPVAAATRVEAVDIAALASDEHRLRAVFALLVNAHYQTRPSDLRQLLDNPDVVLWVAGAGDVVSGVLLGVAEGGMDAAMAAAVMAGERRPRGHLLPQSLAVHAGIADCLTRRVLRVQRIAVHPQCRRQGIGLRLLDAAAAHATTHGFDLLGCAFGVERPLLAFWRRAGFQPARLGLRVDPASATHSLFMLRAATAAGTAIADAAAARFRRDLPWAVGGPLRAVDSRLVVDLMTGHVDDALLPDAAEQAALAAVAAGTRQPETAAAALWKAVVQLAADAAVDAATAAPLVAWQLQHRSPEQVCAGFGLNGRAALHGLLRRALDAAGFAATRRG